jgi:AcrR family transcriptional regulator
MADCAIMQTVRKRGRPATTERTEVAGVALRLFEKRGFDAVTMHEIAEAAGVSPRTLFRHFPTKSDLVWDGLKQLREAVSAQVDSMRGSRRSPGELARTLAEPFLRPLENPAQARLARRRLRLIAHAPALLNHPTLQEIETLVASLFDPKFGPPALVARTVMAVAFAAMTWWAEQGDGVSPVEVMRDAFRSVAR